MPSPFKAADLSPAMAARYGLSRRRWPLLAVAIGIVVLVAGAVLWAGLAMSAQSVGYRVLSWDVVDSDRVVIDFEVDRDPQGVVECALRAQDASRVDVGYVVLPIDPGQGPTRISYPLRTLARGVLGEVLGCAPQGRLRVVPPQFPPGVVPPDQPWRP